MSDYPIKVVSWLGVFSEPIAVLVFVGGLVLVAIPASKWG